ncbi:hypothetical protein [Mesorhizobium sp. CN2-181]|uniref:hypothetical protein n=1 Tax=Mesorhizobium yinganensis TaxID=3157707 RepID=UPI0032B7A56F
MSAFISASSPEGIAVLTDGAIYDATGTIRGIERKITAAKNKPFAVTSRGHHNIGKQFADILCTAVDFSGSVDMLLEHLPEVLEGLKAKAASYGRELQEHEVNQFLIACWSETRGPLHMAFETAQTPYNITDAPFTIKELGPVQIAGTGISTDDIRAHGLRVKRPDETVFAYLRETGAEYMEIMRNVAGVINWRGDGQRLRHCIGGRCDLTLVSAAGVTTETLRVWDDKIGRDIKPKAAPKTVVTFPGMNRQQRRAAERENKMALAQ